MLDADARLVRISQSALLGKNCVPRVQAIQKSSKIKYQVFWCDSPILLKSHLQYYAAVFFKNWDLIDGHFQAYEYNFSACCYPTRHVLSRQHMSAHYVFFESKLPNEYLKLFKHVQHPTKWCSWVVYSQSLCCFWFVQLKRRVVHVLMVCFCFNRP